LKRRRIGIGPAAMVTAAFIGPGTVTTCSTAGAEFGPALLWALLLATLAAILLQEMSARFGLGSSSSLGEAMAQRFQSGPVRLVIKLLIILAIGFGCAAYEAGNIIGGASGLALLTPYSTQAMVPLIGLTALAILWIGRYRPVELFLIGMVVLMSLTFVINAILVKPDWIEVVGGLVKPGLPPGAAYLAAGLIGTTVVPYNLFLHAAAVRNRWKGTGDLSAARFDLLLTISVGGLISAAVLVTAASVFHRQGIPMNQIGQMAGQLKPLLGPVASSFFGLGLMAAGTSSALTAPLAAAVAVGGVSGWEPNLRSGRYRAVILIVILVGTVSGLMGFRPLAAIILAQVTNGILLPVVALFLLLAMNDRSLLGAYVNKPWQNVLGMVLVAFVLYLGMRNIVRVF
jgi:Mn2+/Fe2+ NRAMP family transporter